MAKKDVETLSIEKLEMMAEWGQEEAFQVAVKLANDFLAEQTKEIMESATNRTNEENGKAMAELASFKLGLDYFLDVVERSKERLKEIKKEEK